MKFVMSANRIGHILDVEDSDIIITLQPLSDARSFGHEEICKVLEEHGGTDPVNQTLNFSFFRESNYYYFKDFSPLSI